MSAQALSTSGHSASGADDLLTPTLAWALSSVAGIPALCLSAWALAGGYSFRYLPFALVLPLLPLAIAPELAFFLTFVNGRVRYIAIALAVVIPVASAVATGLAAVVLVFVAPLSLLDDSGRALRNFESLVVAILISLLYAAIAVAFAISIISWIRMGPAKRPWRSHLRKLVLAAGASAILVALAALVGVLNGARLDKQGIPLGPISASWLAARPASALVYSGSEREFKSESGEQRQLVITDPASATTIFFTGDDPDQVAAWYSDQLVRHGWQATNAIGYSTEEKQWAFKRGTRELFRLGLSGSKVHFPDQARHPGKRRFVTEYVVSPPAERP
jgi:hypothetical protein